MGRVRTRRGGQQQLAPIRRTRRKWSVTEKVQIMREAQRPGAVMLEVAHRHGLHPSLLTKWRAQQRNGELGAEREIANGVQLLPVQVHRSARPIRQAAPTAAEGAADLGAIEVEISSGWRLRIRGVVDAGMLRTVLQELSQS